MRFFIRILANSLAIYLAAYFIPGVSFKGDWKILLLAGFILSLINIFIKPILKFISLPLIILTFGLFTFVINLGVIWLLIKFVPQLSVAGWLAFVATAIMVSLVNTLINWLTKKVPKTD